MPIFKRGKARKSAENVFPNFYSGFRVYDSTINGTGTDTINLSYHQLYATSHIRFMLEISQAFCPLWLTWGANCADW